MRGHDGAHDGQPEARAARGARPCRVPPGEPLPDVLLKVGGDAGPVVADLDLGTGCSTRVQGTAGGLRDGSAERRAHSSAALPPRVDLEDLLHKPSVVNRSGEQVETPNAAPQAPRHQPAFERVTSATSWRRLALATWSTPDNPTVYGTIEVDMTDSLALIESLREGKPVTDIDRLSERLGTAPESLHGALEPLVKAGLVVETTGEPAGYGVTAGFGALADKIDIALQANMH